MFSDQFPLQKFVYMKIFSWNIRGINGVGRQRVDRSWLQGVGASVGAYLKLMYMRRMFRGFRSCCFRLEI